MTDAVKISDKVMFYALLLLVIFIPYSAAVIQSCLSIMMLAWIVKHSLIWKSNPKNGFLANFSFPSGGLGWPLIFLTILIVLTIPASHAPLLSLKKFFSRFLQQIFLMYIAVEIINSSKRLYTVMVMLLWTLLVVHADIAFQFFSGKSFIFASHMNYQRVTGPMRHANDLGTLLVTVGPIVLALILTVRFWLPQLCQFKLFTPFKNSCVQFIIPIKVFCIVLLVSILISLGLTTSRGAWVAFVLSMIAGGIFLRKYWWTAGITILLILFLWIFGAYLTNVRTDIFEKSTTQNQLVSLQEKPVQTETSIEYAKRKFLDPSRRFEYWKTAFDVIQRFPLFGCGYNAYIQTLQKLKLGPVEYPHNSIIQITAELGFLGAALFLWFLGALFGESLRILKSISAQPQLYLLGSGIFLGMIAWFIHSLLDTPWQSLQLSILWWLLAGVLMSLGNVAQSLKASSKGV